MAARERSRRGAARLRTRRFRERTQPREDRADVVVRRLFIQIPSRVTDQIIDLLGERTRMQRHLHSLRVRRAEEEAILPRDQEEDAAILGLRNHHRRAAAQEPLVEHEVDTLARSHRLLRLRFVEPPDLVGEDTRRVHHHPAPEHQLPPHETGFRLHPGDAALLLDEARHPDMIQNHRPLCHRRAGHRQRQGRIVELRVPVERASVQTPPPEIRDATLRLRRSGMLRAADPQITREAVIDRESRAVEKPLIPPVGRHHERQRLHQTRRVFQEPAPLPQRLAHQPDLAVAQITHAPMDELRTFRGGSFREIRLLEQDGTIAPRRRIERGRQARRSATDHDHIPDFTGIPEAVELCVPVHFGENR